MMDKKIIIKIHKLLFVVILILITFVQCETYSEINKDTLSGFQNQILPASAYTYFITKNNSKITAQLRGVAVLPCTVRHISQATVSWIRRRDFQLLTVGLATHSSDERFSIEHYRHRGHWSLKIKSVRDVDKGLYECQLSIYPTQSIFVELEVVETITEISGEPDLHINEGSTLTLECKIKRATSYPIFVFWYHNNNMINYDTQNGFTVTTLEPTNVLMNENNINNNNNLNSYNNNSSSLDVNSNNFNNQYDELIYQTSSVALSSTSITSIVISVSILSIKEVHFKHGGNYTCSPSNAAPSVIMVHVLRGEKPAAMQHGNRTLIDENGKLYTASTSSSYIQNNFKKNLIQLLSVINLFNSIYLNFCYLR